MPPVQTSTLRTETMDSYLDIYTQPITVHGSSYPPDVAAVPFYLILSAFSHHKPQCCSISQLFLIPESWDLAYKSVTYILISIAEDKAMSKLCNKLYWFLFQLQKHLLPNSGKIQLSPQGMARSLCFTWTSTFYIFFNVFEIDIRMASVNQM